MARIVGYGAKRKRIRYCGDWVEKSYVREELLIGDDALHERCRAIEVLSQLYETVPETSFHKDGAHLILRQRRIKKAPRPSAECAYTALVSLADLLTATSPHTVHGDVCLKNMVFDGRHLHLVDWEPALKQVRNGRETLLYTEPYLSESDRLRGSLSSETDKLGFFFSAFRLLHGRSPISEVRQWVHRRQRSSVPITPMLEASFMDLSFKNILELAQASKGWRLSG